MSNSPYMPPPSMNYGNDNTSRDSLRRVAKYQRFVIFALLASIIVNVVSFATASQPTPIQLAVLALALVVAVFSMASIFLLAKELMGTGIGVLCAVLMIVPCISLIVLLIVNQKATSFLQSKGVRVGFLGTSPDKI